MNTISRHKKTISRCGGWLMIELLVAMTILVTMSAVLITLCAFFSRQNQYLWARQKCLAAGQAQLDSIALTGKPVAEEAFKALWPSVEYELSRSVAEGQAAGLEKVDIDIRTKIRKKNVEIRLSRYIRPESKG